MTAARAVARPGSLLAELGGFALAFAVFATAGGAYEAAAPRADRPVWWVLAIAAAVVAVMLPVAQPRLQRLAARLLHGERAAGYEVMADFMAKVAATIDVDEVLPRLAETTARSVHTTRGEVSVWLADGRQWRQTWPPSGDDGDSTGALSVEIRHGGDIVGELGVGADGALSAEDRRTLAELAAPAGVALATVRLTVELRQRVAQLADLAEQLEASEVRLVDARRAEQRAVLDRVHTTVMPALDAAGAALASLEHGRGDDAALDQARRAAAGALDALRGVARGVFPSLLADAGLDVALRSWADAMGAAAVTLTVSGDAQHARSTPAVEAALYHAACTTGEAGSAVLAGGDPMALALDYQPGLATLTLAVPVAAFALPERDSQAISDRLGALGGSWETDRGVTVTFRATVPLGAADRLEVG